MYIYVYICICTYIRVHIYIHIYPCISMYKFVHIYMNICIYVYIHAHTNTQHALTQRLHIYVSHKPMTIVAEEEEMRPSGRHSITEAYHKLNAVV